MSHFCRFNYAKASDTDRRSLPSCATCRSMATPTPPMILGESKFTLDISGVASVPGGDEAMSPNATVYDCMKRYNSPRSYQIPERYGVLLDGFFPGGHTDPATLSALDGWKAPTFRVAHSSAVIEETGFSAALAHMSKGALRKGELVEGRETQSVGVTIADLNHVPAPQMYDSQGKIDSGRKTINGSRPLPPSSVPTASVYGVSNPHWTPSHPLSSGLVPLTPRSKCRPTKHYCHGASHQSISLPNYPSRLSLHNPSQPLSSYSVPLAYSPKFSRQPLSPNRVSSVSLSPPDGLEWTSTPINSEFQLPPPATANFDTSRSKEWTRVGQSAVPPLIAWIGGLVAVSSSQPGAVLLFICAGTVILATYLVSPPRNNEETRIVSAFLRRLHDILIAIGCGLIVLGIGLAFPKELALVPLFMFIFFAGLAALFRMVFAPWITATLFGAAILSLMPFIVLTFMA